MVNLSQYYRMGKKDELLIRLIKTVKLDTPSIDFTENVMDYLKEEEEYSLANKGSVLYPGLDKDVIPSLPDEFVSRTMAAIENKVTTPIYKPLISRKTGVIISILFLACYFFLANTGNTSKVLLAPEKVGFLLEWFQGFIVILPMLSMGVFAIALLIFIDFFANKKLSF